MVALSLLSKSNASKLPPMPDTNREQPPALPSLHGETSLPYYKLARLLRVAIYLIFLFHMVGLSSWQCGRANAADEIVVLSLTQEPTDIEFIVPARITLPPKRVATLVKTSRVIELLSDHSQASWDFYLDNTWSILGGDVAQTLASAVQDLQGHSEARLSIEAYCDDRDTSTYSLVIGDRWLSKVESYLVSLGASPSTILAISFGKERLLCQDGSGRCWEANLRLRESFRLMAIDHSEQGCLIRVTPTGNQLQATHEGKLNNRPILQRLHVSLSASSSSK